jgi:hypothetical protein
LRHTAASQHKAIDFFFVRQSLVLVCAVYHGSRDFFALARAAGPVFAAIGQANALANTRSQHGFTAIGLKTAPTGLNGNLKAHVWVSSGDKPTS